MPRAPPVDNDSADYLKIHSTIAITGIENLFNEQLNATSLQDPNPDLNPTDADYLLAVGILGTPSDVVLTQDELTAIVTEAIQLWTDSGLIPAGSPDLSTITFEIFDLADNTLGETTGNTIRIDTTADADER